MIKSRQMKLLVLLCKQNDIRPIKFFAKELEVSNKTIRNDLDNLEDEIEELGLKIVRLQGHGIKIIETDANSINRFLAKNDMDLINEDSMLITSRRREILYFLLNNSKDYTSIQRLSEKYLVSSTSIIEDFKSIEIWLNNHNLRLYRGNQGTKVIGTEDKIRSAIAQYINDFPSMFNLNGEVSTSSRIDQSTLLKLEEMFEKDHIIFFENIISEMEMMLDINIPEPYYLNLITHLLISIDRLEYSDDLEEDKVETLFSSDKYVEVVSMITKKIQSRFNKKFSDKEKNYILQYILGSVSESTYSGTNIEVEKIADRLIRDIEEIMDIPFTKDAVLKKGLIMHLKPMINRAKFGIEVNNPLKRPLKENHTDLFIPVSFTLNYLMRDVFKSNLTEDEISYIVTYFIASIERDYQQFKVIVVCHSGFGTSQLLTTRLSRAFPNIDIVDTISMSQIDNRDYTDIDFIISTVYISDPPIPYIVVSVLLDESEIEKINIFTEKQIKNRSINYEESNFNFIKTDDTKEEVQTIYESDTLNIGIKETSSAESTLFVNDKVMVFSGDQSEIFKSFKEINRKAKHIGWERLHDGFIKNFD